MRFVKEYDFLSNFYPVTIIHDNNEFPTSENAYQYAKVKTNLNSFQLCNPGQAKKMGRQLPQIEEWESKKIDAMREILEYKFAKDSFLALKLILVTEEIVEHNYWHDTFWGVCTCKTCDNKGENMLGKLLMGIRKTLINS